MVFDIYPTNSDLGVTMLHVAQCKKDGSKHAKRNMVLVIQQFREERVQLCCTILSYRMCDYVMYMNRIFFCHVALLKSRVIIVQVTQKDRFFKCRKLFCPCLLLSRERWAESSLKFCLAPSNNQNLGQVENEYKKVATSPRRHTHTTFTTQPSLLIRSNNSPNQLKVYENNNITGIAGGDVSKCWEKWGKWGKSLEGWKNRHVMSW